MNSLALLFLANPVANFAALCVTATLYLIAFLLKRSFALGSSWLLVISPFFWALNFFWELTKIGKGYSPSVDLRVTYPLLFMLTVLFSSLWLIGILTQLAQSKGSKEDVIGKIALEFVLSFLRALFSIIPVEPLLADKILFLFPLLFVTPLFFVMGWVLGGSFVTGLRSGFAAAFLLTALEASLVGLFLFAKREERYRELSARVREKFEAMTAFVFPLAEQVRSFEELAVTKFHAVTRDANELFHSARHFALRLEERLKAIEGFVTTGQEVELLAAEEILNTELDIRESFVDGIQKETHKSHLEPNEWEPLAREYSRKLETILDRMRAQ
ncbi:MAG: hypothetical protein IT290_12360 [Deltaproteobacteria bacterium]|nr:hypothetical protein [Deltaproteobacteria bacterium]